MKRLNVKKEREGRKEACKEGIKRKRRKGAYEEEERFYPIIK